MRIVAIQQDASIRPTMHRKPQLGTRDHISLFDRGILSADALCPELSNVVQVERPIYTPSPYLITV